MVAILVVLTIIVAVAIDVLVMARRRQRRQEPAMAVRAMREPRPPHGVFLDSSHAWLRITTDGTLRVGVDEFLTEALGEIEAVRAPARGSHVRRGEPLVRLRVGGREVAVPAPADGEVNAINEQAIASPWLVGRDPYGVGWVVGLWTRDHQEAIRPLRIGAAATGFLRQEMQRLADFLTGFASPAPATVLADGGVPRLGAVAALDDEGLDGFEREFLRQDRGQV